MTNLYFSPLACSLASRIVIDEGNLADRITLVEVDTKARRTLPDQRDYTAIHPLGLVPALELPGDGLLVENAAVLQRLAALAPDAQLAPPESEPVQRARLHQWLSYTGTELHKLVFLPLLVPETPPAMREWALAKAPSRLGFVAAHLADRPFLLDRFSVADAYLFTVLNWAQVTPISLTRDFPALAAYVARLRERPSVARALALEVPLYQHEVARARARAAQSGIGVAP